MSEAVAFDAAPGTGPELRLAECWADFTKALSIYPETNARVRDTLGAMLEALKEALARARQQEGADPEAGFSVLFREDQVLAGAVEIPMEGGSPFEWLRTRLDRAGLAGIEFLDDAGREGLVAFTRRLLQNFLLKGQVAGFEELWPETYPGLVLIDRRFEGTFGGDAGRAFTGGHDGAGVRTDGRAFLGALLSHPRISRRLERLQEVGARTTQDGEEMGSASELLRKVLDDLPAEALRSRDSLLQGVCHVIDALSRRAEGRGDVDDDEEQEQRERMAELLQRVSRQHFGRQGPDIERMATDTDVVVGPGGGRARDAEIGDDVGALLREVRQLAPENEPIRLGEGPAERLEQLATLLHFLTHLERPQELRGLGTLLDRLLAEPDAQQIELLRRYVDPEGEALPAQRDSVVDLLVRLGKPHVLRACGVLHADSVIATFPSAFTMYLETIDTRNPQDAAELDRICAAIGAMRMHGASRELAASIAMLPGSQVTALLQYPSRSRLPLLRLLLSHHPEPHLEEAATFLRALDLPEHESFVLYHVGDTQALTSEYLSGLIDLHLGRITRGQLQEHVSDVLCRHVEALGTRIPGAAARVESIRHLARFPSVRARRLLQELSRSGFLGIFGSKEPAAVRQVAREVTRQYEAA